DGGGDGPQWQRGQRAGGARGAYAAGDSCQRHGLPGGGDAMSNRRSMKQTGSLGDAMDARLRQQREGGEVQHDTLGAGAGAPLSSGGTPAGGGGVTDDPALPESFVTGLAGGAGNPLQAGDLRLTGSGAVE